MYPPRAISNTTSFTYLTSYYSFLTNSMLHSYNLNSQKIHKNVKACLVMSRTTKIKILAKQKMFNDKV